MKKINCYILSALTYCLVSIAPAQAAFNDAGTDYTETLVDNWFDTGYALGPLNFTDFLVCLMQAAGVGTNALVNATYKATADIARCETGNAGTNVNPVKIVVRSSRADNLASTPQIVHVWFDGGPGEEDGELAEHYLVEFEQTKGAISSTPRALTDLPYGEFTMNWKHELDTDATPNRGSMSFTPDGNTTFFKMFQIEGNDSEFVNGSLKNDGTYGEAHSGTDGSFYALKFTQNAAGNFIVNSQKTGGDAICSDESVVVDYVFDYNLYDQASGDLKNLSGPFSGTYVDKNGDVKKMHAGSFGIWFEDQLAADVFTIETITHENTSVYSGIIYEPFDDGKDHLGADCTGQGCVASDGVHVVIPGATAFDKPLIFEYADQNDTTKEYMSLNKNVQYFGPGSLYGLPWACEVSQNTWEEHNQLGGDEDNCKEAGDWRPLKAYPDGTVLKDSTADSKLWVTKGITKESQLGEVEAAICTSAENADGNDTTLGDLTSVSTLYPELTSSFLTLVTNTWAEFITNVALQNAKLRVRQAANGDNGELITE